MFDYIDKPVGIFFCEFHGLKLPTVLSCVEQHPAFSPVELSASYAHINELIRRNGITNLLCILIRPSRIPVFVGGDAGSGDNSINR